MIIKEEVYTSHATQSYDQQVANSDKFENLHIIGMVRINVKSNIDQYTLVETFCMELKKLCSRVA